MRPECRKMAGHVVGDQRGGDVVVLQFPDGEARALQERPGFIGEDVDLFAGSDGRANHAERGAIAGGGQRARVAVREHGLAVGNQRRAVLSDALVDGDVFETNLDGFGDQPSRDFQGCGRRARNTRACVRWPKTD
jgi:hypothetical protein